MSLTKINKEQEAKLEKDISNTDKYSKLLTWRRMYYPIA